MNHDAPRQYEEHGGHQGKQRRMIKREWRVTHPNKNGGGDIDGMRTKKKRIQGKCRTGGRKGGMGRRGSDGIVRVRIRTCARNRK